MNPTQFENSLLLTRDYLRTTYTMRRHLTTRSPKIHMARIDVESTTPSTLQQGTSTQQYGQPNHDWPPQTQQTHGGLNGDNQNCSSQGWKGGQNQQTGYHYQRPRHDYGASASNGNTSTYYGTSSQAPTQSGTNALNSLAYASGLESAGLQTKNQTHIDRASQSNTPVSATYPQSAGISQERVRSPAQASYPKYPRSSNSSYGDNRPKSSHQNLAASATAASAGATKRQNTPLTNSTNNYQYPASYPSSMGNILSTSNNASQSPVQNRSNSPYQRQRNASQISQPPQSLQAASATQYGNNSTQYNQPSTETTRYAAAIDRSQPQAVRSPYQAPAQAMQSISELQNTTAAASPTLIKDGNYTPNPLSHTEPSTDMPHFIDPSQVYNPYHQEYERRKKEAAAEAEFKAAQSTSETRQDPITSSINQQADPKPQDLVTKRGEKRKRTPKDKKARKSGPLLKGKGSSSIAQQSLTPQVAKTDARAIDQEDKDDKDDMEIRMKTMIDEMRELRSKDPKMFSKLWDTMKKGGGTTQVGSTPTQSPQLSQSTTQKVSRNSKNAPFGSNAESVGIVEGPKQTPQTSTTDNNQRTAIDQGKFPAAKRGRYGQSQEAPGAVSRGSVSDAGTINSVGANGLPHKSLASPTPPHQQPQMLNGQTAHPEFQNAPAMANSSAKLQWKDLKATPPQASSVNGATIWPAAKRKTLANAAANLLMSNPANNNKPIKPEEIHGLLEQNPSYIELCEKLEARGLTFNRQQLARYMLHAVPDIEGPSSQSHSPTEKVGSVPNLSPHTKVASPATLQPFNYPSAPPLNVKNEGQASPSKVNQSTKSPLAPRPAKNLGQRTGPVPKPVPGSKEAQARKRDFSEIVDLTLLSDDENYVMPSKKPRIEEEEPLQSQVPVESSYTDANNNFQGSSILLSSHLNNFRADPFVSSAQSSAAAPAFYPLPQPPQGPSHTVFGMSQPPPKPPPTKPSTSWMAKSMDRKEAMQKKFYNPKTIARDILIASGRHPTERSLNDHLYFISKSLGLNYDADLSTFDWDSIDPGGPPIRRVEIEDIPAGPPKWALGQRIISHRKKVYPIEAQSKDQLLNKFRAKPDQPISGENFKAYPTAENHRHLIPASKLASLQKLAKALLNDSEQASKGRRYDPYVGQEAGIIRKALENDKRPVTPRDSGSKLSVDASLSLHNRSISKDPNQSSKLRMDNSSSGGKRRGRPPGSKNKNITKSSFRDPLPSGFQVQIPVRSPPHFPIFYCRWQDCDARLHNLVTLRKHMRRHLKPENHGSNPCLWKGCRATKIDDRQTNVTFPTEDAWHSHIETEHLEPLAKRFGDGPSTTYSGKHDPSIIKPIVSISQFAFKPSTADIGPMPMPMPIPLPLPLSSTSHIVSSSHAAARDGVSPHTNPIRKPLLKVDIKNPSQPNPSSSSQTRTSSPPTPNTTSPTPKPATRSPPASPLPGTPPAPATRSTNPTPSSSPPAKSPRKISCARTATRS